MQVNFLGPIRLTLALLPQMLERGGGQLINVSSVAATLSSPGEAAYDASKAALSVFSEAMAMDLWGDNIKVLVVYPGVVDTPLFTQPGQRPVHRAGRVHHRRRARAGDLRRPRPRRARGVHPRVLQGLRHREGERRRRVRRREPRSTCGSRPRALRKRDATAHPLDPITGDEIRTAVALVAADDRFEADFVFAHLRLREPHKDVVLAHAPGAPVDREVEALLVPPGRLEAIEVVVSVTAG